MVIKNYTAVYTAKTSTVSFNSNGGSNVTSTLTVQYKGKYGSLPSTTRTGYTFNGWYLDNTKIVEGSEVTAIENHTLVANWTAKTYTVTLKANSGGTVSASSISVNYGSTNTFTVTPSSGYYLSSLSCDGGYTTNAGTGISKTSAQMVIAYNNSKDNGSTCTVSFTQLKLSDYIKNKATSDTTNLAYDGTSDNNLRYIGSNPPNYIKFNNQVWRIIGVMNNVESGSSTTKGTYVKIIQESIGDYSWDTSYTTGYGYYYGNNTWNTSTLKAILNSGAYWNAASNGTCSKSTGPQTEPANAKCDMSSYGLQTSAKGQIAYVKWNVGGHTTTNATAATFYGKEITSKDAGNVGLMSPSDYGYAVGGSVRDTCLGKNMSSYSSGSCNTNNWLKPTSGYQWAVSPISSGPRYVFSVHSSGFLDDGSGAVFEIAVRPVVYLKSDIKYVSGSGTSTSDPIIIG